MEKKIEIKNIKYVNLSSTKNKCQGQKMKLLFYYKLNIK